MVQKFQTAAPPQVASVSPRSQLRSKYKYSTLMFATNEQLGQLRFRGRCAQKQTRNCRKLGCHCQTLWVYTSTDDCEALLSDYLHCPTSQQMGRHAFCGHKFASLPMLLCFQCFYAQIGACITITQGQFEPT